MPSIRKPLIPLVPMATNNLGLTIRDYEAEMSTLCAGCGHDSITAAIVRTFFELSTPPHMIAKLSGIGCSAKTPTYFVRGAHGFNSVHGRMAPIATGVNAANRNAMCIGISGDGDSLSIGLGHLVHAIRRNVHMVYVIENNGVYGLTKGQLSASADVGSRSRRGGSSALRPVDPVLLALEVGGTFVARSFSGDKEQLVPILKAALSHRGFALIDVISPCVQFNNQAGSTKSYHYVREHEIKRAEADYIPAEEEIRAAIPPDQAIEVRMHGGGSLRFRSLPGDYDPTDRRLAIGYVQRAIEQGEIATGLLYVDEASQDVHELNRTPDHPLADIPYERLCPGSRALDELQAQFR